MNDFDCAVVVSPVVDIRKERLASRLIREKDPLQETQVLYGDLVHVQERSDAWAKVSVPDQLVFDEKMGWIGYVGWIETRHLQAGNFCAEHNAFVHAKWAYVTLENGKKLPLSIGTKLAVVGPSSDQKSVLVKLLCGGLGYIAKEAIVPRGLDGLLQHLGDPYLWGGMSAFHSGLDAPLTGIDCSGLVYQFFRLQGKSIPRNAADQFLQAKPISGSQVVPGDLIFMKNLSTNRIDHVMIYFGGDQILESTMRSRSVRLISAEERLGAALANVSSGHVFDGSEFYFMAAHQIEN